MSNQKFHKHESKLTNIGMMMMIDRTSNRRTFNVSPLSHIASRLLLYGAIYAYLGIQTKCVDVYFNYSDNKWLLHLQCCNKGNTQTLE